MSGGNNPRNLYKAEYTQGHKWDAYGAPATGIGNTPEEEKAWDEFFDALICPVCNSPAFDF